MSGIPPAEPRSRGKTPNDHRKPDSQDDPWHGTGGRPTAIGRPSVNTVTARRKWPHHRPLTAADHRSGSLARSHAIAKLPAQDLERARAFYRDQLGLEPSKGTGERGAWFRDSEGNLLGLGQATR